MSILPHAMNELLVEFSIQLDRYAPIRRYRIIKLFNARLTLEKQHRDLLEGAYWLSASVSEVTFVFHADPRWCAAWKELADSNGCLHTERYEKLPPCCHGVVHGWQTPLGPHVFDGFTYGQNVYKKAQHRALDFVTLVDTLDICLNEDKDQIILGALYAMAQISPHKQVLI